MGEINPRALRDAFGTFLTGVTVITTVDASGDPKGFTANSFTSVSLDPALLLFCLAKSSSNLEIFRSAKGFAVNILSEKQQEVSSTFAKPVENRFGAVSWRNGPHGSPVFDGVSAWFDCATHEMVDAGDHLILIGEVKAFEAGVDNGLGYARGSYFTLGLERQAAAAAMGGSVVVSAVVERNGQVLLYPDEAGRLGLPSTKAVANSSAAAQLSKLLVKTGITASIGFIYSVYEDRKTNLDHLVYHCIAGEGVPAEGGFVSLEELPFDKVADPATNSLLRRFVEESRMGQFSVYFGDESTGTIRRLAAED